MSESVGSVSIQLKLDKSGFDRDIRSLQNLALKPLSLQAQLDTSRIEKQLAALTGNRTLKLTVEVDDRRLYALNKHFDLKEAHARRLNQYFRSNPFAPQVDFSRLDVLDKRLKSLSREVAVNVKLNVDTGSLRSQIGTLNVPVNLKYASKSLDPLTQKVQIDTTEVERGLSNAVEKAFKRVKGGGILSSLTSVVTAPAKLVGGAISGAIGTTLSGLSFGITQQVAANLGKGVSSALDQSLRQSFGSSELLGKYFGAQLSKGMQVAFEGGSLERSLEGIFSAVVKDFKKQLGEEFVVETRVQTAQESQRQAKRRKIAQKQLEEETLTLAANRPEVEAARARFTANAPKLTQDIKTYQQEFNRVRKQAQEDAQKIVVRLTPEQVAQRRNEQRDNTLKQADTLLKQGKVREGIALKQSAERIPTVQAKDISEQEVFQYNLQRTLLARQQFISQRLSAFQPRKAVLDSRTRQQQADRQVVENYDRREAELNLGVDAVDRRNQADQDKSLIQKLGRSQIRIAYLDKQAKDALRRGQRERAQELLLQQKQAEDEAKEIQETLARSPVQQARAREKTALKVSRLDISLERARVLGDAAKSALQAKDETRARAALEARSEFLEQGRGIQTELESSPEGRAALEERAKKSREIQVAQVAQLARQSAGLDPRIQAARGSGDAQELVQLLQMKKVLQGKAQKAKVNIDNLDRELARLAELGLSPRQRTEAELQSLVKQIEQLTVKAQQALKSGDEREAARLLQSRKDLGARASTLSKSLKAEAEPPQLYKDIVDEVARESGVQIAPKDRPKLVVDDEKLSKQGRSAEYRGFPDNAIAVPQRLFDQLSKGELSNAEYDTFIHELRHGVQFDFGRKTRAQAARSDQLLTPTPKELSDLAYRVEGSAGATTGDEQRYSRKLELDAYTFAERNTQKIRDRIQQKRSATQRQQAVQSFEDTVGAGGGKVELKLMRQQTASLLFLEQETQKFVTDLSAEIKQTTQKIEAAAEGIKPLLEKARNIEILPADEIAQLQQDLRAQADQAYEQISDELKQFRQLATAKESELQGVLSGSLEQFNRKKTLVPLAKEFGVENAEKLSKKDLIQQLVSTADLRQLQPRVNELTRGRAQRQLQQQERNQAIAQTAGGVAAGAIKVSQNIFQKTGEALQSAPVQKLVGATGTAASAMVAVTKAGYAIASGLEAVALDLIPMGRTLKGIAQQTVVPAGLFLGASALIPGGGAIAGGLAHGAAGLLAPAGHALAGGATGAATGAIGQLTAGLPTTLGIQGSVAGALTSAVTGMIDAAASAAIPAIASAGTAILGGKAIQTAASRTASGAVQATGLALPASKTKALPSVKSQALPAGKGTVEVLPPVPEGREAILQDLQQQYSKAGLEKVAKRVGITAQRAKKLSKEDLAYELANTDFGQPIDKVLAELGDSIKLKQFQGPSRTASVPTLPKGSVGQVKKQAEKVRQLYKDFEKAQGEQRLSIAQQIATLSDQQIAYIEDLYKQYDIGGKEAQQLSAYRTQFMGKSEQARNESRTAQRQLMQGQYQGQATRFTAPAVPDEAIDVDAWTQPAFEDLKAKINQQIAKLTGIEPQEKLSQTLLNAAKSPVGQDLLVNAAGFGASAIGSHFGPVPALAGDLMGALAMRHAVSGGQHGNGKDLFNDLTGFAIGNASAQALSAIPGIGGLPFKGAAVAMAAVPQIAKVRDRFASKPPETPPAFDNTSPMIGDLRAVLKQTGERLKATASQIKSKQPDQEIQQRLTELEDSLDALDAIVDDRIEAEITVLNRRDSVIAPERAAVRTQEIEQAAEPQKPNIPLDAKTQTKLEGLERQKPPVPPNPFIPPATPARPDEFETFLNLIRSGIIKPSKAKREEFQRRIAAGKAPASLERANQLDMQGLVDEGVDRASQQEQERIFNKADARAQQEVERFQRQKQRRRQQLVQNVLDPAGFLRRRAENAPISQARQLLDSSDTIADNINKKILENQGNKERQREGLVPLITGQQAAGITQAQSGFARLGEAVEAYAGDKSKKNLKELRSAISDVEGGLKTLKVPTGINPILGLFDKMGLSAANLTSILLKLGGGFLAFQVLQQIIPTINQFVGASLDAALNLDRLKTSLNFIGGSSQAGAKGLTFVRGEVDKLGIALKSAQQGYVRLSASTRGTALQGQTTDDLFTGLSGASAVLGLAGEEQERAFTALSQIASKGCYDEDTKVLTDRGWVSWPVVRITDRFATLDLETGEVSYQLPVRLISYHHAGKMLQIASPEVNLLVTPDHRLVVRDLDNPESLQIVTAKDLEDKPYNFVVDLDGQREEVVLPGDRQWVDFDGRVYCAEVPNTTLYVERAGIRSWSGNSVQAEELRGQLSEAIPGSFSIAARAIGKTEGELNKLLETGSVTANEFLPKFAAQLKAEFGGAAEQAGDKAQASVNRFQNSLLKTQEVFGKFLQPAQVGVLKAVGGALDLIGNNGEVVGGILSALTLVVAGKVVPSLFTLLGASKLGELGFMGLARGAGVALKSMAGFAGQMLVATAIIQGVGSLLEQFVPSDLDSKINEFGKSAVDNFEKIQEAAEQAGQAVRNVKPDQKNSFENDENRPELKSEGFDFTFGTSGFLSKVADREISLRGDDIVKGNRGFLAQQAAEARSKLSPEEQKKFDERLKGTAFDPSQKTVAETKLENAKTSIEKNVGVANDVVNGINDPVIKERLTGQLATVADLDSQIRSKQLEIDKEVSLGSGDSTRVKQLRREADELKERRKTAASEVQQRKTANTDIISKSQLAIKALDEDPRFAQDPVLRDKLKVQLEQLIAGAEKSNQEIAKLEKAIGVNTDPFIKLSNRLLELDATLAEQNRAAEQVFQSRTGEILQKQIDTFTTDRGGSQRAAREQAIEERDRSATTADNAERDIRQRRVALNDPFSRELLNSITVDDTGKTVNLDSSIEDIDRAKLRTGGDKKKNEVLDNLKALKESELKLPELRNNAKKSELSLRQAQEAEALGQIDRENADRDALTRRNQNNRLTRLRQQQRPLIDERSRVNLDRSGLAVDRSRLSARRARNEFFSDADAQIAEANLGIKDADSQIKESRLGVREADLGIKQSQADLQGTVDQIGNIQQQLDDLRGSKGRLGAEEFAKRERDALTQLSDLNRQKAEQENALAEARVKRNEAAAKGSEALARKEEALAKKIEATNRRLIEQFELANEKALAAVQLSQTTRLTASLQGQSQSIASADINVSDDQLSRSAVLEERRIEEDAIRQRIAIKQKELTQNRKFVADKVRGAKEGQQIELRLQQEIADSSQQLVRKELDYQKQLRDAQKQLRDTKVKYLEEIKRLEVESLDRTKQLISAIGDLAKAQADANVAAGEGELGRADKALEIRQKLDDKSTPKRLKRQLRQQLQALGFSSSDREEDILKKKQDIEDNIARQKQQALAFEQQVARATLEIEIQKNKLAAENLKMAAEQAKLVANANAIQALQDYNEARKEGDTEGMALAGLAYQNASLQSDLADRQYANADANLQSIDKVGNLQRQTLGVRQQSELSQFANNDFLRNINQAGTLAETQVRNKRSVSTGSLPVRPQLGYQAIDYQGLGQQLQSAMSGLNGPKPQAANNSKSPLSGLFNAPGNLLQGITSGATSLMNGAKNLLTPPEPINIPRVEPQMPTGQVQRFELNSNQFDRLIGAINQLANSPRSLSFTATDPVESYADYQNRQTGNQVRWAN